MKIKKGWYKGRQLQAMELEGGGKEGEGRRRWEKREKEGDGGKP